MGKGFAGFRSDQEPPVVLPASFFTELLPLIDDLGELKVTLACWRVLTGPANANHLARREDLDAEAARVGLEATAWQEGLERAVARGTLLRIQVPRPGQVEEWYVANTETGRAALAAIQKGEFALETAIPAPVVQVERPNIFVLYEQTMGLLSPLIADELRDAEATYPMDWIEDAFREAVRQNVRSWAYVRKILERRAQRDRRRGPRSGDASQEWARFIRGET